MALDIKGAYRDMPLEARIECPHCGDSYHHQGAAGHIKWCAVRSPETREERRLKKRALKEITGQYLTVRGRAVPLVNPEGERVGLKFSVSKQVMAEITTKMKVHIHGDD